MAGVKRRFYVQFEDGTIRTVTAQGHTSAKREFIAMYHPPRGAWLTIFPMDDKGDKKRVRV
jgi:hypothetical protein